MTTTYDPSQVFLMFGIIPISGYAEGSMIKLTPVGDGVKAVTGTAGETAFIETPNRQHDLTFRLFETANKVNAALAAYFNAGNVPAPVALTSLSTGLAGAASAAKLERIPEVTYDNGVPVREWKLVIPKFDSQFLPLP